MVDMALSESAVNGITLSAPQAQLVHEMATSGARLQLALTSPRSGNDATMATLARAWTHGGGTVIGLASSAAAASILGEQLNSRTDTLATLTRSLTDDPVPQWVRDIDARTLIVIDQAGMASTNDLAAAVRYTTGRGGAVRLITDEQRLASMTRGVLRDIAQSAGANCVTEPARSADPVAGAASQPLRAKEPCAISSPANQNLIPATPAAAASHTWRALPAATQPPPLVRPATAQTDPDPLRRADTPSGPVEHATVESVPARTGRSSNASPKNAVLDDEALFHAARQREYSPGPDLDAFDTERQVLEANIWDKAPVPQARVLELNELAADFFCAGYPDSWGPGYVISRLRTDLTDHPEFRPGYAPAGWTTLTDHLRRLGARDEEILAAGLALVASTGRIIDRFRGRLVLPIYNGKQIHGFIGRRHPALANDIKAGPKYLNTPETDLFHKGTQLFGLSEGRPALDAGATPVLVEGFFDAVAVTVAGAGHYAGLASLGTSFTDQQANQLRSHVGARRPGVTVATDGDLAGEIAAQRAFWMLTARGDTPRHVRMRDGEDPADVLASDGPTALRACLNGAQPLAIHLLDERLDHLRDTAQVLAECAAIIAAQPPQTWVQQIDYASARITAVHGCLRHEVVDAARRWTLDPLGSAQAQIGGLSVARSRLAHAAPTQPCADPATGLDVATGAGAPGQLRRDHQCKNTTSVGAPTASTATHELPTAAPWRRLAHTIDSRLTTRSDWPILLRAIQEAEDAGCDVASALAQLAAKTELPTRHPATELAYRLRGATRTLNDTEPVLAPACTQTAVSLATPSDGDGRSAQRHPGRAMR